jgi:formyltetrahydrofolate-dependent phosphoribosylglycinamide formyltransferase
MASESVAIEQVNADFVRHIERGEIVTVDLDGQLSSRFFGQPKRGRFCTLENVYFLRPESFNNELRVQQGRIRSGEMLADRMEAKGIEYDVSIPIQSSGYYAGRGFAERSGKPMIDAVGTDHYAGRTFIMPGQENRSVAVNGKHKVIPEDIAGLRVATVDDSCMRTTTARRITGGLLKRGRVAKVHPGFAAPPAENVCDLGVAMRQRSELPASQLAGHPHEEIEVFMAGLIGGDSATFLTRQETSRAFGREEKNMCTFCFGGEHPVHGPQEEFPQKERPIVGKPKLAVFISGSGTNLQKIIDGTENGSIDADIITVVSNNPDAFGLKRAEEADIPTIVVSSKKRLSDPIKRAEYEEELLVAVINNPPDVLVLAGFMTVLSDEFLQAMQELEIPVLNLHPGLLTVKNGERVATSQGLIPVLRGTNAIEEAYSQGIPTSGVTVHQLLPGNAFDTGPIVLKQEVHRRDDDTREDWERRIHETEYQVLPIAINRVLHVMKHTIDVSRGDFPW